MNQIFFILKHIKISFSSVTSAAKKSALICVFCGFIMSVLCLFGTCLIPVWYLFVSISIGIFPYVFVPQTLFLNQKRRKAPFPDFLNFTNSHLPGVPVLMLDSKNHCRSQRTSYNV
jgi:uncharacterized membrane protein